MIRRALRSLRRLRSNEPAHAEPPGARGSEWYDWTYRGTPQYHGHYSVSSYYFLWTVVADRLRDKPRVLDLGCGPGQFATLLYDKGIRQYHGIDFSEQAIGMAHLRKIPDYRFTIGDLTRSEALSGIEYDAVVTMEFLEHVEPDLAVLANIKPGARVLATVPNFPYTSHVRHFQNAAQVTERYSPLFGSFAVDTFLENAAGKTFYLIDGVKA